MKKAKKTIKTVETAETNATRFLKLLKSRAFLTETSKNFELDYHSQLESQDHRCIMDFYSSDVFQQIKDKREE